MYVNHLIPFHLHLHSLSTYLITSNIKNHRVSLLSLLSNLSHPEYKITISTESPLPPIRRAAMEHLLANGEFAKILRRVAGIAFFALRDIECGEELYMDYELVPPYPHWYTPVLQWIPADREKQGALRRNQFCFSLVGPPVSNHSCWKFLLPKPSSG